MIGRRQVIAGLGAAAAWPLAVPGQQPATPVIGFISGRAVENSDAYAAAFRKGLNSTGYSEGHNVAIDYHWLAGQYDRLPAILGDLIRRRVAVIVTPGSNVATLAAKAATSTIPVVFSVGDDPVKLGLVTSLSRPDANVTGINFFVQETTGKRLRLLHDLVPKAVRIAVINNPANVTSSDPVLRDLRDVAPTIGVEIATVLNASTIGEIDAAFATLSHERPGALFVAGDAFLNSRNGQFATLAARDRLPTAAAGRDFVTAGGLMSYGADGVDSFRQVGVYAGSILKGAKPAELPVLQSTRFEFLINLQTARALDIEVPPGILAIADEVIE
jgi:putative tryptophan/tyrosine transport system substrate-binding protein